MIVLLVAELLSLPGYFTPDYGPKRLEVATGFGAAIIIPCNLPIYRDDPRQQRLEDLCVYASNIKHVAEQYRKLGITVIPLVKGESEYERRICYEAFAEVGLTYIACYCAQFSRTGRDTGRSVILDSSRPSRRPSKGQRRR